MYPEKPRERYDWRRRALADRSPLGTVILFAILGGLLAVL